MMPNMEELSWEPRGKHFILEEAKAVLLLLSPVTSRIQTLTDELTKKQKEYTVLQHRMKRDHDSVPVWEVSEVRDAMQSAEYELQKLFEQVVSYGCLIKGVNPLLLDFPAVKDTRTIYLCWRYDEPTIAYWHELNTGFHSRQPL